VTVTRFGLEPGASLAGLPVAVCGFARTGQAAAALLVELGAKVRVLDAGTDPARDALADALGVELTSGREDAADLEGVALCVASPGVKPGHVWWRAALDGDIPWWSEIELAWRAGMRPLAAITGTNGKTTTVEMLTACLRAGGIAATAAGNIGTPLASRRPGEPLVAEVSSFQLAASPSFTAPVAAWLNLAPDHLDWHADLEEYASAKASLFRRLAADATAIVHPSVRDRVETAATVRLFDIDTDADAMVRDGWILVDDARIIEVAALRRPHRTFVLDALAAAACATALGTAPGRIAAGLIGFEPLPHRLEPVATIDGVAFVNDSKATDPQATEAALASFAAPVVLIAGGQNKGLAFQGLAATGATLRAVIAIGDAADEVAAVFEAAGVPVERIDDLVAAVRAAMKLAQPGDTVLLSPACSSYDRFRNYEHRGDVFRDAVLDLERSSR
jgi:UDP-N-acetylmuramoylalanine--D-glutamate ligase